jgi:hypothetical protein
VLQPAAGEVVGQLVDRVERHVLQADARVQLGLGDPFADQGATPFRARIAVVEGEFEQSVIADEPVVDRPAVDAEGGHPVRGGLHSAADARLDLIEQGDDVEPEPVVALPGGGGEAVHLVERDAPVGERGQHHPAARRSQVDRDDGLLRHQAPQPACAPPTRSSAIFAR